MAKKCKGEDHVQVLSAQSGGDGDVWSVVKVTDYYCRNAVNESVTVYVLTRNGKPKLHMLPELAELMPTRLRMAAAGGLSARGQHKKFGLWVTFATWSFAGALALANKIEAVAE